MATLSLGCSSMKGAERRAANGLPQHARWALGQGLQKRSFNVLVRRVGASLQAGLIMLTLIPLSRTKEKSLVNSAKVVRKANNSSRQFSVLGGGAIAAIGSTLWDTMLATPSKSSVHCASSTLKHQRCLQVTRLAVYVVDYRQQPPSCRNPERVAALESL